MVYYELFGTYNILFFAIFIIRSATQRTKIYSSKLVYTCKCLLRKRGEQCLLREMSA